MKFKILIFLFMIFSETIFALSFQKAEDSRYNYIYAIGKIYSGDVYRLHRVYESLPKNKQTIILFSSNGGELAEGIKLGKFIYQHRIATAVLANSYCASSCALAYLGGRSLNGNKLMYLSSNTKVGFHNFYYKNRNYVNATKVQEDLSNLVGYFSYVNAPNKLMYKMLKTKPTNMFWISNRINHGYLNIKKLSMKQQRNNSVTNTQSSRYSSTNSKEEAIKKYFLAINNSIKANRGYIYNKRNYALNTDSYQNWLSQKLNYVYINSLKFKHNKVNVKVTYALRNGKTIYSNNIYKLQRTQYGWRVASKIVRPLRKYRRLARGLENNLP